MTGAAVLLLLPMTVPLAGLVEHWLGVSGLDVDLLGRFAPPSSVHPLRSDIAGRDGLARLFEAAKRR